MKRVNLTLIDDHRTKQAAIEGLQSERAVAPALSFILKELRREQAEAQADGVEDLGEPELRERISVIAARAGLTLSAFESDEILAQVAQQSRIFGLLQPLVDNSEVSDIIVLNFGKIEVQQGRRNMSTALAFPCQEIYEAFVERLLQRAGTTYSTKKTVADGMIGPNVRIHAVHRTICESGPYLTIRLNRLSSVSIDQLIERGLAPTAVLEYLRGIIHVGGTVFVAGEVGTGKTTLIRALAASIPADESILVIEDTPEIQLEHPHVRSIRTREENSDGAGKILPSEVIRAGMRMAMNRIVFGEIRDAEAAEAFIDVCASGHPGLSTIHARSAIDAVGRLELFLGRAQRGAAREVLTAQVAAAVQVIVHIDICRLTGRRRIMEVVEIGPVADGVLRQRQIFRYLPENGVPRWSVVNRVSAHRDRLEKLPSPVALSALPGRLELSDQLSYREAVGSVSPGGR